MHDMIRGLQTCPHISTAVRHVCNALSLVHVNGVAGVRANLFDCLGKACGLQIFGNATQRGITNTTMCYQPVKVEIGTAVFSDLGIQSGYICPDPTQ